MGSPAAAESTWERRFMVGASIDPSPNGVVDLGLRREALSLQLLTDTLEVRWAPEGDHGRSWLAARAELGAVGLLISPWFDGTPVPEAGFAGGYLGGEAGRIRYLPHGFYVGGSTFAYYTAFYEIPSTQVPVPDPTPWLGLDALGGWWSPHTHAWLRVGVQHDTLGAPLQPHAHLQVRSASDTPIGHRAALHAGTGRGQSILTRTRVGGLNPYAVPLAGAGWGEWWAETYAIARLGPQVCHTVGENLFTHALVFDGGVVDDALGDQVSELTSVWGVGALHRWEGLRWFAQADLGWAGGLTRTSDVPRWSGWLLVGKPWN